MNNQIRPVRRLFFASFLLTLALSFFVPEFIVSAQTCPDLSGSYSNKMTGVMRGKFRGEEQVQDLLTEEEVTISQTNCTFSYKVSDPAGANGEITITGSVAGLLIQATSKAAITKSAAEVTRNEATYTGTIREGYIDIDGTGTISGTLNGEPFNISLTYHSVLSNAMLTAPTINNNTEFLDVLKPGQPVSMSVEAVGLAPLRYQWSKNGTPIPGATNSVYNLGNIRRTDGGTYRVDVTNALGKATAEIPVQVCNFALVQSLVNVGTNGGTNSFSVTFKNGNCDLSVVPIPGDSWFHFSSSTSTETNATITYVVETNSVDRRRVGYFKVEDLYFTIVQDGAVLPPPNLMNKTLHMTTTDLNGSSVSNKFLIVMGSGTNQLFQMIPRTTDTTWTNFGNYGYFITNRNATVTFTSTSTTNTNTVTVGLTFTNEVSGSFVFADSPSGSESGVFWITSAGPDATGDKLPDIFFQNTVDNRLAVWGMDGLDFLENPYLAGGTGSGSTWKAVGAGDFNSDNHCDVVFHNTTTGKLLVWFLNGTAFGKSQYLRRGAATPLAWRPVGVADFNTDGRPDILFQNSNGAAALWLMRGTNLISTNTSTGIISLNNRVPPPGWRIVGTGDFNADGHTDILWQANDGKLAAWLLIGTSYFDSISLPAGRPITSGWRIAAIGDFDLNARTDLFWQNTDRRTAFWLSSGSTNFTSVLFGQTPSPLWRGFAPK